MLNFDTRVNFSDAAQPRVTNVKPLMSREIYSLVAESRRIIVWTRRASGPQTWRRAPLLFRPQAAQKHWVRSSLP